MIAELVSFSVEKAILEKALKSFIIEKKQAIPILTGIVLEATDNKLSLYATDLETSLTYSIPATITGEGKVCVNAKKLTDIVKLANSDMIIFETDGDETLHIKAGKSKYKLQSFDLSDYPYFPNPEMQESISIPAKELQKGLSVAYALDKQGSLIIQSLAIDIQEKAINFVATNGHRLAFYSYETQAEAPLSLENLYLLSRKSVNELQRLLENEEEVLISFDETEQVLSFKGTNWKLTTRIVEANYPDYLSVFPENFTLSLTLDKKELEEAIERVAVVIDSDIKPVVFEINGNKLTIRTLESEENFASEEIGLEENFENFIIAFNSDYILQAIKPVETDKVLIRFTSEMGQTLILPENEDSYKAIIMPMQA